MPEVLRPKRMRSPNKRDTPRSPPGIIQQCGICKKTVDQHLLAKCDNCHKHYHLGCLEPPLSRMPKKTKLMGWQCSECDNFIKEEQARKAFNPDAPRRLREKVKEPNKFTPPEAASSEKKKGGRGGRRRKRLQFGAKRKLVDPVEDEPIIINEDPIVINEDSEQASETVPEIVPEEEMPVLQKERPHRTPRAAKGKVPDANSLCAVCHLPGEISNLVSCDRCAFLYHFHCLDPPLRKSPKKRGYAWECCACNPPTSQDSDSSEDAVEEEQVGEEVEEIHLPDDDDDDDYWVSMGTVDEETAMLDQSYSDDDDDIGDVYGIKDQSVEDASGAKPNDEHS